MADEITLDAPETRLERFLAAAAGVEGITLDEPETRIERYLYKIAQGGGGSGGGVLVVTDTDGTLDKTWQEIHDALAAKTPVFVWSQGDTSTAMNLVTTVDSDGYSVFCGTVTEYIAESADDYPSFVE